MSDVSFKRKAESVFSAIFCFTFFALFLFTLYQYAYLFALLVLVLNFCIFVALVFVAWEDYSSHPKRKQLEMTLHSSFPEGSCSHCGGSDFGLEILSSGVVRICETCGSVGLATS